MILPWLRTALGMPRSKVSSEVFTFTSSCLRFSLNAPLPTHVHSLVATVFRDLKAHLLARFQSPKTATHDRRVVHENFIPLSLDEAVALGGVEPLHGPLLGHDILLPTTVPRSA